AWGLVDADRRRAVAGGVSVCVRVSFAVVHLPRAAAATRENDAVDGDVDVGAGVCGRIAGGEGVSRGTDLRSACAESLSAGGGGRAVVSALGRAALSGAGGGGVAGGGEARGGGSVAGARRGVAGAAHADQSALPV